MRSTSVASIAHLTSSHVTTLATAPSHSQTAETPRSQDEESRSSGTANHASDNHASDEEDELDEDEDDDFLAHQTSAQVEAAAGKRKGKAR